MNNEEKRTLLKRLYDEGKITIDEMLVLSMKDTDEPTECSHECRCNKKSLNDIVSIAVSDAISDECGLDVDKILDYMGDHNWCWMGKHVTREMFIDKLRGLIFSVLMSIRDYIREDNMTIDDLRSQDKSWTRSTDCIEVTAYIDDNDLISIDVAFILDQGCASASIDDIIETM